MPSDQRLILRLGERDSNPDAKLLLDHALAFFTLLESVDKEGWQVKTPRYIWRIENISKNSPVQLEAMGELIQSDYRESDVGGVMVEELEALQASAVPKLNSLLNEAKTLRAIEQLGKKGSSTAMPIEIVVAKTNTRPEKRIVITNEIRQHAKLRRERLEALPQTVVQLPSIQQQYIVTRGLLTSVTADPRERRRKFTLRLAETDDGFSYDCMFDPINAEELGAHVGNWIFVEGFCDVSSDSTKRTIEVAAYRLIPKTKLSEESLAQRGLSIPDNQDAIDFVSDLRAEHD
jgi:hypothetical protein